MDERAFNELRQIRAENDGMALQEFKQMLREQFFGLLLDKDAALAAIPAMLPADPAVRAKALDAIRLTVGAAGKPGGERAKRLAEIEKLFAAVDPKKSGKSTARKTG